MIHNQARKSASCNQNAIIRLRKKMAGDVREQTHLWQTYRYSSTKHLMQPRLPISASEDRETSAQPLPLALAEKAAIILALNVTSGKKPNQS